MVHAALAPSIGRDYEPFLFASIGPDRHGQALSVISALARSDLDPWREAVQLSRMPLTAATARLSRLIAALPGEPAPARPLESVAGDLIALLPANGRLLPPLPGKVAAAAPRPGARLGIGLGAVALVAAIALLATTYTPQVPGRAGPQVQHAPSTTLAPGSAPAKYSGAAPD